jgi:membrane-bound lytic murein transglycosylase D
MEIMTMGESQRRKNWLALLPMLLAVLVLAGCARVASAPVATTPSGIAPQEAPALPTDIPQAEEPSPVGTEADVEVASEDDAEPAEEVEPSPLDELPETAPEISASVLEKDKQLVAEAFPTFDIPMVLNDQVVAYVEYFSTRHKELFSASLVRSGRYVEAFQSVFDQAGIPKDLVYMAHVESAFKTNAYSRAKAKGIYQFIAATGRRYGLRIDSWVDERSDPEKSARAAAAYLKDLHGMFGDWYLALAAYNAGEGKIQRSLAKTKKDDFWSLASTRSLRAETRNYVPAILAATLIAKQPEKFGFDVHLDAPVVSDVVRIEGQTDLRVLARLADVDPETFRQLNPQLRRGMTPPGTTTDVYVPVGLGEAVAQAYATMPVADRLILVRHQVGKGESLAFIARHYGVTSAVITSANHLGKSAALRPGQELIIPAVAPPMKDGDGSRANAGAYRVRKGDTLSRIASQYRTTPSAIASASGIGLHSSLRIGQRLVIPAKGGSARASASTARVDHAPAPSPVVHTVRPGETLYRIADHYQVTVNQICALNRINADGVIYPGTRLKIRAN